MQKNKVVVLGASGHAKVIIDIIESAGLYEIVGVTDPHPRSDMVLSYPVLGNDEVLPQILRQGIKYCFVALGNNKVRAKVCQNMLTIGFKLANAISPFSYISKHTEIGVGVAIMPGVVVHPGTKIGNNVIINTGASVDHDCNIGDNVHLAPGTNLAGAVTIEEGAFLGVGCKVIPEKRIGAWSILGAGAVIITDVPSHSTFVGVPGKVIKKSI